MHPACPNKKQNHLQNSLLRRTQFWVRKTFSKPASLKRASLVALPVAISHKASLKPKGCTSDTLIQKTSKNEPKQGPKNGTAWRSHFWDRMHSLVKEQKKTTFTVPFLVPSHFWDRLAVPKMRPQNRKINSKGRPVQQTNYFASSDPHHDISKQLVDTTFVWSFCHGTFAQLTIPIICFTWQVIVHVSLSNRI